MAGSHCITIAADQWEGFRRKLQSKVRFHVGNFCPDIDDLVQETLARFQRALNDDAFRKPESVGPFLSGICNNVIHEYRRRLWREVPYDDDVHRRQPVPAAAEMLEMRNSIGVALEQLSERDRRILTAFYLQEKDKDEICREMGTTDAQFRVIIFRAKERLRRLLSDHRETLGGKDTLGNEGV